MYLFYFYVPKKFKEKVKKSCFDAGAGKIGEYENCSFEYNGIGQFTPSIKSNPFLGKRQKLKKVKEIKIEMLVSSNKLKNLLKNFFQSHPYEEPAYGFIKIFTAREVLDKKASHAKRKK